MQGLCEKLNDSLINEAREEAYTVAFTGFVDKDGLPISTTIYVPKEHRKAFEKYLSNEKDNTIYQAEGYTNDWSLED